MHGDAATVGAPHRAQLHHRNGMEDSKAASAAAAASLPSFSSAVPAAHPGAAVSLRCESCASTSAAVFCVRCDKLLCTNCDSRVHASHALASHERGPAAQVHAHRVQCAESHPYAASSGDLQVRFWCRSCNRPVCVACRAPGGAHSTSAAFDSRGASSVPSRHHECVLLEEQAETQLRALSAAMGSAGHVQSLKERMLAELRQLAVASTELQSACSAAEASELSASQQVLARL